MKCEICNRTGAGDGANLFRINPLGQIGVWRCTEHLTKEQKAKLDPEVVRLVDIIGHGNDPTQLQEVAMQFLYGPNSPLSHDYPIPTVEQLNPLFAATLRYAADQVGKLSNSERASLLLKQLAATLEGNPTQDTP